MDYDYETSDELKTGFDDSTEMEDFDDSIEMEEADYSTIMEDFEIQKTVLFNKTLRIFSNKVCLQLVKTSIFISHDKYDFDLYLQVSSAICANPNITGCKSS